MFKWFCENILLLIVVIVFAIYGVLMLFFIYNDVQHINPERIERVSEGELINMRFLGSWYNETELKFANGSMTVVPFWFSQQLKIGKKYKIWWSSKTGWHYEELK